MKKVYAENNKEKWERRNLRFIFFFNSKFRKLNTYMNRN